MIFFMQFTFVLENNYVYRNIHLIFKKFIYFLLLEFNLKCLVINNYKNFYIL